MKKHQVHSAFDLLIALSRQHMLIPNITVTVRVRAIPRSGGPPVWRPSGDSLRKQQRPGGSSQTAGRIRAACQEVREHAKESSKRDGHAVDLISEKWCPRCSRDAREVMEGEGKKTFLDDRSGVTFLKVSVFEENIRLEYTIRQDSKKISVRVTAPDYSVSEESGTYYKEPQPVPPSKNYLGLELEELLRDPGGRLLIKDVAKGTAAFYAGIMPGDSLVMIDTYDTKNFDIARVDSYLASRAAAKAKVRVTVSQKGEQKIIDIQL